jgi:hypothetical protein
MYFLYQKEWLFHNKFVVYIVGYLPVILVDTKSRNSLGVEIVRRDLTEQMSRQSTLMSWCDCSVIFDMKY